MSQSLITRASTVFDVSEGVGVAACEELGDSLVEVVGEAAGVGSLEAETTRAARDATQTRAAAARTVLEGRNFMGIYCPFE